MSELNYVAIDFETANSDRGSACAAALVRFRGGEPVESWTEVFRPPAGIDHFDAVNSAIHGIGPADVMGRPRYGDVWPRMEAFIRGELLVAHNAAFDIGVIRRAHTHSGLDWPTLRYADSMVLARRQLDLLSNSLPWVADALGIELAQHHDPLADATASGLVMAELVRRASADSVPALLSILRIREGRIAPGEWAGCAAQSDGGVGPALPAVNPDADPEHPLYGHQVVFTGGLDSLTRQEAWDGLSLVGGIPQKNVTKTTSVLVIGPSRYDGTVVLPGRMSGKMKRAADLRATGQAIEIMCEAEFLRAL